MRKNSVTALLKKINNLLHGAYWQTVVVTHGDYFNRREIHGRKEEQVLERKAACHIPHFWLYFIIISFLFFIYLLNNYS